MRYSVAWMADPANWALVALIGAGVLLVAAVVTARAKADRGGVRVGVRSAALPGVMTLLAVAGAAQSLLIVPAIRHFATTSGHAAAARHAAARPATGEAASDGDGDGGVQAPGGLILTESEYALAMQGGDPVHVGFTARDMKFGDAPAFGRTDDAFLPALPSFVAAPLRILTSAALAQHQQDQALAAETVADLVNSALGTTGHGDTGSKANALSSATGTSGSSSTGQTAQPSLATIGGGSVPAIPPVIRPTLQPAVADVPEPSTWATMVIGFAACGWTMRRAGRRARRRPAQD